MHPETRTETAGEGRPGARVVQGSNEEVLDAYRAVMENEFEWNGATIRSALNAINKLPAKPYRDLTSEDMDSMVADLTSRLARPTLRTQKVHIRRFLRWVNGDQQDPDCIASWSRRRNKGFAARREETEPKLKQVPDELFEKLVQFSANSRDRALWTLIRRAGIRKSEAHGLDVGELRILSRSEAHLQVDGKTGKRTVPLGPRAIREVGEWLRAHPDPKPGSPLFTTKIGRKRLSMRGIDQVWERTLARMGRAGIQIPPGTTIHGLRHARAFEWKEKEEGGIEDMMSFFGWTTLTMPISYGKRNGADMISRWRQKRGIEKPPALEVDKADWGAPCRRCNARWPQDYQHCPTCGEPLTNELKAEESKRMTTLENIGKALEEIPSLRKEVAELKAAMKAKQ